jgi:shikimate kinase
LSSGTARVVVLLGAPGSGKSTVGEELERLGLRWRNWELVILERWGSRDNFVLHKAEALPLLHDEILDWIDAEGPIAVFETTGLSDAPLLDRLVRDRSALVVRLDVSERGALARVAQREQQRHLSDSIEVNRVVWRAFYEHAADHRSVALAIDTEAITASETAAEIAARVGC